MISRIALIESACISIRYAAFSIRHKNATISINLDRRLDFWIPAAKTKAIQAIVTIA